MINKQMINKQIKSEIKEIDEELSILKEALDSAKTDDKIFKIKRLIDKQLDARLVLMKQRDSK